MTFVGRTSAGESAYLSLVGQVPEDLPARLDAASVDRIDAGHYRIAAGERIWTMSVSRCDLHCDLGERFYRAVPPRRAPLSRRILWRLVLAAARTPIAGWWLTRR
ncbi:MAG TPA: hypothetical protein VMD03_06040 [Steroidobacteraceae bacterium]|nr:hypothetical protein [Steroidobacteraceae bacterium]